MSSDSLGNFYYFAYGTYVDSDVMAHALAAAAGGTVPVIHRHHPGLLPGYRLVCDAVSAEGPRLGRLNITPLSLIPRDHLTECTHHVGSGHAKAASSGSGGSDEALEYVTAFRDGVRGMLYELPADMRAPLLQAVAQEGSFNMYAMLTCYELNDVQHGMPGADAQIHEALVIAALDLPLLEHKYLIERTMKLRWTALPAPHGASLPLGLASTSFASEGKTHKSTTGKKCMENEKTGSCTTEDAATATAAFRWPGLHWCNCICSTRVAPSASYVAMIQKAYTQYLMLECATEEDEVNGATRYKDGASTEGSQYDDRHGGAERGCASYGQTIYRMVYQRTRDVAKDPLEAKTWYLAYGSNLSWEQVCLRIGPPYQRRAVKLRDYVLVPNKTPLDRVRYASFGYYNVEPVELRRKKEAQGLTRHHNTMPSYVCGAAYEISVAQLKMMDNYETGYDRQLLRCTDLCDSTAAPWDCWTYIARETSEELLPSREYLSRVLEGSDILPLEYMECIRATPTNPLRSPRQDQRLRKEI